MAARPTYTSAGVATGPLTSMLAMADKIGGFARQPGLYGRRGSCD